MKTEQTWTTPLIRILKNSKRARGLGAGTHVVDYAISTGLTAITLLVCHFVSVRTNDIHHLLLIPIAASAYAGGFRAGLLSIIISVTGAQYLLIDPVYSFYAYRLSDLVELLIIAIMGGLVSFLIHIVQKARNKSESASMLKDQLDKVAASVPGAIYTFRLHPDGSTSFPYFHPMLSDYFGLTDSELSVNGSLVFDLIHPEDLAGVRESIYESAKTLLPWHHEYRVRHPVHGEVWLEGHSIPLRESDGITLWHGFIYDITARKTADAALRESELLYRNKEATLRALLDSISDLVFIKDTNLAYLGCNKAFEIYSGMKEEYLIGRTDFDITSRDVAEFYQSKDREMLASGNPLRIEEWIPFKCGGGGQFDTLKTPFHGPDGQLLGLIGISRNISERKQYEQGLHLQSTALNAAADAIVITSRDGTIEWVNQAFTNITGYSADETIGSNPRALIKSNRQSEAFYANLWSTIMEGRIWRGEIINRHKNGKLYTADMTITPVRNDEGEIEHFIAIKQDITELKIQETQRLRANRLESVGRLASGIAHDLNNILSPILLGTPFLRDMTSDPTALEIINTMESGAERGAAIIKQLLTFSRGIEAPRVPVKLRILIRDMVKIMEETFPKNIIVRQSISDDAHIVYGDATQIHQVLMNLCVNARDAMPDGGTLTLSLARQDIDESTAQINAGSSPGQYVLIKVSDTGMGIHPELVDKVFDPFFTTKEIGEGTGLGLSTVLGIVHNHQGFIQVDSQSGAGTAFCVYLPAYEEENPEVSAPVSDPFCRGNGETILVVDDEDGLRRVSRRMLENNGYTVLEAHHGASALEVIAKNEHRIALVLTDLVMPVMDGHSLIRSLRRKYPGLKIVSMSGNLNQPEILERLEAETHGFLSKPFNTATLMSTLNRVLVDC